MSWIYLMIAGIFEIGWPLGFKMSATMPSKGLGIGAVGTLIMGIVYFGDSAGLWRLISAFLIIVGIIGLKLSH